MKYIADKTGRFSQRPYFTAKELDDECEALVRAFLQSAKGTVEFPIRTDDLTKLIERDASDLDLYADLTVEGDGVEGLTEFYEGRQPSVKISATLSEASNQENRLRTTLAHEWGHVKFHGPLVELERQDKQSRLFAKKAHVERIVCKRDNILDARESDWLEWQAGYICGAVLMPRSELISFVANFRSKTNFQGGFPDGATQTMELIAAIAARFLVSRDAAWIRLLKLQIITPPTNQLSFL